MPTGASAGQRVAICTIGFQEQVQATWHLSRPRNMGTYRNRSMEFVATAEIKTVKDTHTFNGILIIR